MLSQAQFPAPSIREWLARTCSINVVPERGSPTIEHHQQLSAPHSKAVEKFAIEGINDIVNKSFVILRVINGAIAIRLYPQGVGLTREIRGAVEILSVHKVTSAKPNSNSARASGGR